MPPLIRVWLLALTALALVVSVATGGTAPHVHDDEGWWNEEHDLVLLATASPSMLVAAAPALVFAAIVAAAWTPGVAPISLLALRPCDARAPPLA